MENKRQFTLFDWSVFTLIIGFILFLASYFFLPFVKINAACFDSCNRQSYPTLWNVTLGVTLNFSLTSFGSILAIFVCYLLLISAMIVFSYSIVFLMSPRQLSKTWLNISWWIGILTLLIMLPFLFFFNLPQIGYLGLWIGFILMRVGFSLLTKQNMPIA